MKRPKNLIPVFRPSYDEREIRAISKVLKSGWIGLGPKTQEFEEEFAKYVDAKYAIALNSATSALHLALVVSGINKGDEVIVPALTFASTAHAVEYCGAKPIFADIDEDSLCISVEDIKRKISPKTKAVIVVHYGGNPCDLDSLNKLSKKHGFVVIEDAAHACGSTYKGRKIGSISSLTCFSFHAVKNLATGDGGMITTNDLEIAEKLKRLRWMGITKSTWGRIEETLGKHKHYGWYYEVHELGYKYHMNDITAALGIVQLKKLEITNKRRQRLTNRYEKHLSKISEITIPKKTPNSSSAQHNFVIITPERDGLYLHLKDNLISTGVHYMPLHLQPYYKNKYKNVSLPATESVWEKILTLPLYPDLSIEEQDYVIGKVKEYFDTSPLSINKVKKENLVIRKNKIKLRSLSSGDIESLRTLRNKNRDYFINKKIVTKNQQQKWFSKYKNKKDDLIFTIEDNSDTKVGFVSIYNIDQKSKKGEYGRLIIENEFRGNSHAIDATNALLDFAFSRLQLEEIMLEVLKSNKPAINLYRKLGFEYMENSTNGTIKMIIKRKTFYS